MAPFLSDRNFSYMWVVWSRQCGGAGGRPGPPPPTPTNHIPSLTWIMTELSELEISYPTHSLSVNNKRCKYSLSQEEWTKLRESVPYVKLYRYNPKQLYPISLFHRAFFNSIMDKTPTHALFYSTLY